MVSKTPQAAIDRDMSFIMRNLSISRQRHRSRRRAKGKPGYAKGKIDTDLAFNRERLQRDGPVRSAYKNVGIGAEPD